MVLLSSQASDWLTQTDALVQTQDAKILKSTCEQRLAQGLAYLNMMKLVSSMCHIFCPSDWLILKNMNKVASINAPRLLLSL